MSEPLMHEAVRSHRTARSANGSKWQGDHQGEHQDELEKVMYDAELLRWLLRFPLQRIADLAMMSGLSIPQTYARIKAYEGEDFVASVRTAGSSYPS
ncbi:MAG: hypothetical protein ACRDHE_06275, partial [Ktedonobacterales bacterium]